jgi:FKBP-type peptidyl-prolyl cis-trans isomerase FklB
LLVTLKREIVASERNDRIRGAPTLRNAGLAYMEENARREDVQSHESGVQYRVIQAGKGARPKAADTVRIRYKSWRLDGQAFHDSTTPDSEPETMRIQALIPGLREMLPLMAEGARWEITIPPDLAFGRRGPLADQTVTYDLELLAVIRDEATTSEATP